MALSPISFSAAALGDQVPSVAERATAEFGSGDYIGADLEPASAQRVLPRLRHRCPDFYLNGEMKQANSEAAERHSVAADGLTEARVSSNSIRHRGRKICPTRRFF
jgi:hypothetical protein